MAQEVESKKESQLDEKHAGGRPLKFDSVAKLDMAIQLYFDKCDPHVEPQMIAAGVNTNGKTMFDTREVITEQKPYTMAGLARAIGVDRKTLLNYKKRDEYFPSIKAAIDRCEEYAESQLFGPYSNGAKFNLINNYRGEHQDWTDKTNIDHTSDGEPVKALVEIVRSGDDDRSGKD